MGGKKDAMKKFIMFCLAVFILAPLSLYAAQWVYVEDGKIIRWRNSDSALKDTKLEAHGYIPFVIETVPSHDLLTQTIEKGYRIEEKRVVAYYIIKDMVLADAKARKMEALKQYITSRISELLDPSVTVDDVEPLLTKLKTILSKMANAKTIKELQQISYEETAISN